MNNPNPNPSSEIVPLLIIVAAAVIWATIVWYLGRRWVVSDQWVVCRCCLRKYSHSKLGKVKWYYSSLHHGDACDDCGGK